MNEFILNILETLIGTLAGGVITIIINNRQIRIQNNLRMANELVEGLDDVVDMITTLKFRFNKYIKYYLIKDTEQKKQFLTEKDILSSMKDLAGAFIKVSKSFKRSQGLLEEFHLSYSIIYEQYEQFRKLLYESLNAVKNDGYDLKDLRLMCDTGSTLVSSLINNIKVLENDLQDKYYYKIYNRKLVKALKNNSESM